MTHQLSVQHEALLTVYPVPVPVAEELYGRVHHLLADVEAGLVPLLLQALAGHPDEAGQAVPGRRHPDTEHARGSQSEQWTAKIAGHLGPR